MPLLLGCHARDENAKPGRAIEIGATRHKIRAPHLRSKARLTLGRP